MYVAITRLLSKFNFDFLNNKKFIPVIANMKGSVNQYCVNSEFSSLAVSSIKSGFKYSYKK